MINNCKSILLILITLCHMAFANLAFQYDTLNRLTQTNYGNGTVETYSYDILGNRTSHIITVPTPQFPVIVSSSGNGTVSPTGTITVIQGSTLTVNATSATGYHFSNWNISGNVTTVSGDSAGKFTINGNATVAAIFAINTFDLAVMATAGGGTIITPTVVPITVNYGVATPIVASPLNGYKFVKWIITSGTALIADTNSASTQVTLTTSSIKIQAIFSTTFATITVDKTGNGTVSPYGANTVNYDSDLPITATASSGYHFVNWTASSGLAIENSAIASTKIKNITATGTVTAFFSRDTLPGSISIDSIDSHTGVYLYATNSWIGKKVLDGPGTINSLKPGTYRLCCINSTKERLYRTVYVKEGADTLVHVSMSNSIPMIFMAQEQIRDNNNTFIRMNTQGSTAMDDIDGDCASELVFASQSGTVTVYKNTGEWTVHKTFSVTLSAGEAVKCIRIADIDYSNKPDLIIGLNTGRIFTTGFDGSNKGTLFTAPAGLVGFDFIDMNHDGYPDILMGFGDGTMKIAQSTGNLAWSSPSTINVSVSANASPVALDLDGNGMPDIMCGNGNGDVNWFSDTGSFAFLTKGPVNSGGMPLKLSSDISLSAVYCDGPSLPFIIMNDSSGTIYKAQAILSGDINNEGVVDILDLRQIGIHWGMTSNDPLWDGNVNLNLTPGSGSIQVIDLLDLQAIGKSWGIKK